MSQKVDQVHMALTGKGEEVQVSLRMGKTFVTRKFEAWGQALAAVNFATAWNGAPDPTPSPSGTPTIEEKAVAA